MVTFIQINPPIKVSTPDGDGKACMIFQDSIEGKSYLVILDTGSDEVYKEDQITIKEM